MIQYILLTLKRRFEDYETRGGAFKDIGERMEERKLHVRIFELLIIIMKIIIESLDIIIDDIDMAITKITNQNKLTGIPELLSQNQKPFLI